MTNNDQPITYGTIGYNTIACPTCANLNARLRTPSYNGVLWICVSQNDYARMTAQGGDFSFKVKCHSEGHRVNQMLRFGNVVTINER